MKKLITLCYYSYPKALPDIKEWEHKFWDEVIHKEVSGDGNYLFIIQRMNLKDILTDSFEYMFCVPKQEVLSGNCELFADDLSEFKYYKALYIGDFTEEEVLATLEFTKKIKASL